MSVRKKKGGAEPPKKKRFYVRFLTVVMLIVLISSGGINGYCLYQIFGKGIKAEKVSAETVELNVEDVELQQEIEALLAEESEADDETGSISYIPTITDSGDVEGVITGEDSAYDMLESLQGELGIVNVREEYKYSHTRSNDMYECYSMQQYYDGIEVYGYEMNVTADKSGNAVFVTGTYAPTWGMDTYTNYSHYDAEDTVEKYLKSKYMLSSDEAEISYYGKVINPVDDSFKVGYVYFVSALTENVLLDNFIFVDGNQNSVTIDNSMLCNEMITLDSDTNPMYRKLQGQQVVQTLDVWKDSDERYMLKDENRKLYIEKETVDSSGATNYLAIEWNPQEGSLSTDYASGVDALANLERAYDFYLNNFSRVGVHNNTNGSLRVLTDMSTLVDNAGMAGSGDILYIGIGSNGQANCATYLDIMGHEFSHGVLNNDSGLQAGVGNNRPPSAFKEGIADIFGELIEDYCDDGTFNNSCNWIHGADGESRNIKSPETASGESPNGYAAKFSDYANQDGHLASTLVSYPAYLMTQGINGTEALTTGQLAKLYYNTFPLISSSDGFEQLRDNIQTTAMIMNCDGELSDKQLESVIDSFDEVQIGRLSKYYSVTPGAKIVVFDYNDQFYRDYDYTVYKKDNSEVASGTADSDHPYFTLSSSVQPGIYRLVLSDRNSSLTKEQWIIVNDNVENPPAGYQSYKKVAIIKTKFGSQEKEIVLTLDCSGSMEGTPIDETRIAAVNFIDTVFANSPNVKVSIVKYSGGATCTSRSETDQNTLRNDAGNISSGGGTNMYEAVSLSKSILDESESSNKFFIFMSDGIPTESPDMSMINAMKNDDVTVCTLGFFHNLSGSELNEGIELLRSMASEGYYFNVQNASDLDGFFNDIARQVGGERFAIARIACPVDVIVTYNGETLSSAEDSLNTRTSFGSLSFEGEDNEVKVLRLDENADYDICIVGTGKGKMEYSISFADENGDYTDERVFKKIPISKHTIISTNSAFKETTELNIDSDGDGKFDEKLSAKKNGKGEEVKDNTTLIAAIVSGVVASALLITQIALMISRFKKNRKCSVCGKPIKGKRNFCNQCGTKIEKISVLRGAAPKQKASVVIAKLAVIAVCCAFTLGVTHFYGSAANTVFMQVRDNQFSSALALYENGVEDSSSQRKYLDIVLNSYLKKVDSALQTEAVTEDNAYSVYSTVMEMGLDKSSDYAEELLEELPERETEESDEIPYDSEEEYAED